MVMSDSCPPLPWLIDNFLPTLVAYASQHYNSDDRTRAERAGHISQPVNSHRIWARSVKWSPSHWWFFSFGVEYLRAQFIHFCPKTDWGTLKTHTHTHTQKTPTNRQTKIKTKQTTPPLPFLLVTWIDIRINKAFLICLVNGAHAFIGLINWSASWT